MPPTTDGEDDKNKGVHHDRVGDGEERNRAGTEGQRRDGDKGVRGIEVAAYEEPGDNGAEAPSAQAPFVQLVEVTLAPVRRRKPKPDDKGEQQQENNQRNPVDVLHRVLPVAAFLLSDVPLT